jgi:Gpi18-like mannosyltransferase
MWLLRLKSVSVVWSLVYAWNPLCILEFAGSGHNDSLMICLLLAGFILYEKKKDAAGVLAFAAATLSKFIPIVMLPWMLFQKRIDLK